MKKKYTKYIFWFLLALFALIIMLWVLRNPLMRGYANLKINRIEEKYDLHISYQKLHFTGFSTLTMRGLFVVPNHCDTLLRAENISVALSPLKLLFLQPQVTEINANNILISLVKNGGISNYDCFFKNKKLDTDNQTTHAYATRMKRILDALFTMLPSSASLKNFAVSYKNNNGDKLLIELPLMNIRDHRFRTVVRTTENGSLSDCICEGVVENAKRHVEAQLIAHQGTKISIPFIGYRWNAMVQFDTLSFSVDAPHGSSSLQQMNGQTSVCGLTLHHERISPDTVQLDNGIFHWNINVGPDYAELDSTTNVRFNRFTCNPYLKIQRRDTTWHVRAAVDKRNFLADDLFSSLPKGLFYNLEGIQTEGFLTWHFLLDVDFGKLDNLTFESTLTSKNFYIRKMGNTNLSKMNEPFQYTAYEQGAPVRTFEIGPANPSFRTTDQISRFLPLSILMSEDAGFFHHAGFLHDALRESLIKDLKVRRFARGGSTLSMQLVKNVFLSRNKTIARKLEEILITWLIENNHLTSKDRMFEVYMNIVEWGPLIYGASEASHFYFDKEPSQLTLSECIFLAGIIPKPKHVRSCFDESEHLKSYFKSFYNIVSRRLVSRELVMPEDTIGCSPDAVVITGPAASYLRRDTIPVEAPIIEILPEQILQ